MIEELIQKIIDFRDERGWTHTDTPSALAKSIVIEASELLEHFQWSNSNYDEDALKEELADVLMYSLALAHDLDFNVEEIIQKKLDKNKTKYPIK